MFAGIGVTVLAVAVILLAVYALQQTGAEATGARATPKPTFSFGGPAPLPTGDAATGTPTPSPTADAGSDATTPGADERFLAVGEDALWRGTAGACGGDAPTIEVSYDTGATWTDVTPTYRGIAQLRTLSTFGGPNAETVADVGEDCETQALRTFTAGEFWAPYPDELASSTYVDPADDATIITPDGAIEAPCAEPWDIRARGGVVALICDGSAYVRDADEWAPLVETGAAGLSVSADGAIAIAHTVSSCDGVAISRYEDGATDETECVGDVDPRVSGAIAFAGDALLLWFGDAVVTLG
ncbi:hypothetical protein FVP74_03175 [Microbacterium saccharophilum]|uniref:Exo-alpha-sialidase n=1 Tax=Microbacterium saccharophilum TaxID=1213358 RepID=A0A5C8IAJ2_9MICO|nr:hypothetical protein [Microbacterium saccharophilum]TXK15413.1 hypothetical protein FVP74_03175 [Microbacterium saccharophilum]